VRARAIQEPVFSVANTDFEGGDHDNGHGDYIFLVKRGQPSHSPFPFLHPVFAIVTGILDTSIYRVPL
jgi:hypothetical protein